MMRAVERTLAIFECFSNERPSLTLQEIANRIRLAKSTTFRLVQSLDEAGYLVRLDNQEYCLSFRITRLAGLVRSTLDIRQLARTVLAELARRSRETVTLNMVSDRHRVCIDVIDTPSPLMSVTKPGERVRLIDGATAKTLMAFLPKKELQKAVAYAVRVTGKKRADFVKELARIRDAGYAVTHGERVLGLTAITAAVADREGDVRYCVTVTGPTVRLQPRVQELVRLVTAAASDISRRLGAKVRGVPK
ncbi:MAG: IclR family transcriptional regulator [Betaproteobacteria bacterium]|nr:IclR family transcriptional regulator [Betaproteobacteria bacterium]